MRNEEIKKIKENILNPLLWEYVYLIILSFFLLFYSLYTVQYPANWPQPTFSYLRTALFVYVFLKYTFMNKECLTMNEIALIFILLCSFLTSYQNTGYIELLDTVFLILGAKGLKYQSVLKTYLLVKVMFIISVVLGSQLGILENLVYNQHGRIRESFGFIYPTDFAAQVFFVIGAWAIFRKLRLTAVELIGMVLLAVFLKWKCDARTSMICILCITGGAVLLKIAEHFEKRNFIYKKVQRILKIGFLSSPYIFAGFMILACRFYNSDNSILAWINRVTSQRLRLGKKTFDNYNINLFGQYIEMAGNGGTTKKPADYTFIDCSYSNILMRFGLVVFVVVMLLITFVMFKYYQSILVMGVFAVICLHSVMEHHLLEIHYNFMLLLPFCLFSEEVKSVECHIVKNWLKPTR